MNIADVLLIILAGLVTVIVAVLILEALRQEQ